MGTPDASESGEGSEEDGERRGIAFRREWRTAAGWVCVSALAWWFVLRDLFQWFLILRGIEVKGPVPISLDYIITILGALLGLGITKAVERVKGVSSDG